MAKCCTSPGCRCTVTAGPGITVDGNGSTSIPYVISADGATVEPTVVQAGDTATADNTVTGTGVAGDPYVVTTDVILDPAPPGGGTNLLQEGPDGLFVECAQVRTCLTAGDGIDYDPVTGTIAAEPAAPLVTADSNCIALTGDGTAVAPLTAAPVVDPAPGNALVCGPGGLMVTPGAVSCDDVRPCLSAGDGIVYDPVTGEIAARPSTDAGNTLGFGADGGLMVPPSAGTPTALEGTDTPTVDITVSGTGAAGDPFDVSAAVRLDSTPPGGGTNLIGSGPDGLYLECAQVRTCLTAGDGIDYDAATGTIAAEGTVVEAGTGVTVTGTGSAADPYEVSATPPETGCGLTGDGSAGAPLEVATGTWPYACDPDVNGTAVVCDSTGVLRGEPRSSVYWDQLSEARDYANIVVPAGFDVLADTFTFQVTNPNPCRPVMLLVEREADVDFDLPAGAGAASGQDTDETSYVRNTGTTAMIDHHIQSTKLFRHTAALAPGATATINFPVTIGRGSAGATYNRIQVFIRALMITV
ncbi:hypothetical protein ACFVH9_07365 [Streptomyces hirsutus]|uniref:hypothetical protein n=1 Tax=Streptomyces hirsutus TaxID=35620 RepID=UPI003630D730